VRIEPTDEGKVVLIDVVCKCGRNGLQNKATGGREVKHRVELGIGKPNIELVCLCTKEYVVRTQRTHCHVFETPPQEKATSQHGHG
jgi:hypothetical protein